MPARHLTITKRLTQVQGKTKPVCEAKAIIPLAEAKVLLEHFANEPLFRRAAYANGFDDGGIPPGPGLTKMLGAFTRNDACPEVLVKTIINGQRYEAISFWDTLCFEFVAKRSFDALVVMCEGIRQLDQPQVYHGYGVEADVAAFEVDTAAELLALAS